MHVTAFSGRRGHLVRRGTVALLTTASIGALTGAAVVTTAAPADAWDDGGYAVTMTLSSRTTDQLTDGRNFIADVGRADLTSYGDRVTLKFPVDSSSRDASYSHVVRLDGGVAYTGAGPDVTWTRLRVNFDTHRVTARVNGGDRRAVLRIADTGWTRDAWGDTGPTLRLTSVGAGSLDRAADGAPFSAGDVFAGDSSGCTGF